MSFVVTYECRCDLCGEVLNSETLVLQNNPDYAWPVPQHLQASRVLFHGRVLDMCNACSSPLEDAFQAKIGVLRAENRLVGFPKLKK